MRIIMRVRVCVYARARVRAFMQYTRAFVCACVYVWGVMSVLAAWYVQCGVRRVIYGCMRMRARARVRTLACVHLRLSVNLLFEGLQPD